MDTPKELLYGMRTPGDSAMLCRFAHVQSVTFFARAVVCTVILRRGRGSATFGSGRPRRTRATSVEGSGGPRCIPGYLRAAAGPGRASRSTTPSRRLACGDLAGGPPPPGITRRQVRKRGPRAVADSSDYSPARRSTSWMMRPQMALTHAIAATPRTRERQGRISRKYSKP